MIELLLSVPIIFIVSATIGVIGETLGYFDNNDIVD